MLIASSRRELFDSERVGSDTKYFEIETSQFVADSVDQIEEDAFFARLEGLNVLLLVHGYNNDFHDVIRAYSTIQKQIQTNVTEYYDEVIGYTWPASDSEWEYFKAKRRAGVVAPRFGHLIENLVDKCEALDLMSHSLGARVVLRSLVDFGVSVRANFLLASAIDNESIQLGEQFGPATGFAEGTVVFHTKHDAVLRYAYSAAEWDYALGYLGPEDPADILQNSEECYVVNCKNVVSGHGQYKYSQEVFTYLNEWLSGNIETQFSTL